MWTHLDKFTIRLNVHQPIIHWMFSVRPAAIYCAGSFPVAATYAAFHDMLLYSGFHRMNSFNNHFSLCSKTTHLMRRFPVNATLNRGESVCVCVCVCARARVHVIVFIQMFVYVGIMTSSCQNDLNNKSSQ